MAVVNLKLALTVALRFSATRRQFGPTDDQEIPVLEYQLQVGPSAWLTLTAVIRMAFILNDLNSSLCSAVIRYPLHHLTSYYSLYPRILCRFKALPTRKGHYPNAVF